MRRLSRAIVLSVLVASVTALQTDAREESAYRDDAKTVLLMHLDGNARDASGCRHNAAPQSGAVEYGPGRFGQAVRTVARGILATDSAGAFRIGDQSWTLECWVRADSQDTPMSGFPVRGGFGPARSFGLGLTQGVPSAWFHAGSGRTATVNAREGIRVDDGRWHHLTAVRDMENGGHLRLYVDGVDVSIRSVFQPHPIAFGGPLGRVQLGANFDGWLDEVRMSNTVRPAYRTNVSDIPAPTAPDDRSTLRSRLTKMFQGGPKRLALAPECTVLVTPDAGAEAEVTRAATLTQEWLRARYGTQTGFEILRESAVGEGSFDAVISLGDTVWGEAMEVSGLSPYGFRIQRHGRVIVIRGATALGTRAGAAHFLDRLCDVRCYLPSSLFIHCPTDGGVVVDDINISLDPALKAVTMTGVGSSMPDALPAWRDLNVGVRDQYFFYRSHGMSHVLDIMRLRSEKPDLFALVKGSRKLPTSARDTRGWQLCLTHPDLEDELFLGILGWFRRNPHLVNVHLSANDSGGFCECATCHSPILEGGDDIRAERVRSDLWADLIQRLAKRMEEEGPRHGLNGDEVLSYGAYSQVRLAPSFAFRPHVMPVLVFKISDCLIDGVFNKGGTVAKYTYGDDIPLADRWKPLAATFGHHDWAQGQGYFIPRIYTHHFQNLLRGFGNDLQFMHVEGYPNWGLDGPKLYMFVHLGWDPSLDLDAVWLQFCDEMFGPASRSMYAYFRGLEKGWDQLNGKRERKFIGNAAYASQFQVDASDERLYRKLRRNLDRAAKQATTDVQRKRVDLFSKSFAFTEMLLAYARRTEPQEAAADALRRYAEEVLLPDPLTVFRWANRTDRGRGDLMGRVNSAIRALDAQKNAEED